MSLCIASDKIFEKISEDFMRLEKVSTPGECLEVAVCCYFYCVYIWFYVFPGKGVVGVGVGVEAGNSL